jgi:hypothetical protein
VNIATQRACAWAGIAQVGLLGDNEIADAGIAA